MNYNNLPPKINIVIPLHNEEEVFLELINRLKKLINKSELHITVILIDDGSNDNTANLMKNLSLSDERFSSIFLSRNFGHQIAMSAGLSHVDASEAVFILDGDLQDPPELLPKFYQFIKKGYDVVYAIRKKRKESYIKVFSYNLFYRFLKQISYIDIPLDTGDFSLISRRVIDHMNNMPEQSRFLRGMRSWVGFKQIGIEYERSERFAGNPSYNLKKLFALALNGIFNFSEYPIKFISNLGLMTLCISMLYFFITLMKRFLFGNVPEGFTAIIFLIILFGGVQLLAIGIIGEYLIRIFFQVKERPLYIIKERIFGKQKINE